MFKQPLIAAISLLATLSTANAEDLITVYQLALQSAPNLQAAGYKLEMGAAQKGQSLGLMLPQVMGSANWSENNSNYYGTYAGVRYYVSLSQTVMDFAKYWDWQRTRDQERQFNDELIEAQQNLIVDVVKRYFAILDAEDQLYYINTEQKATENYKLQMDKLFAKQLVKITDVYEVESRLDQIKADRIEIESQLTTAQEGLKELTNISSGELARLKDNVAYKELEGKLDDWLQIAKSENPALRAQRNAILAASDDVSTKKSRHLPSVDLQLYYYDTNTGYQSSPIYVNGKTVQSTTEVAAINVNVPIFSGGVTSQGVRESQSKLNITQQENEAKTRALIKETSEAFTLYNANARRIQASEKAVESASKSFEAMQTGFKYNVKTLRDVLEAQQLEYKAKRDLSKARYNYIANRIRFLKAIGTVSEDNLLEINEWLDKYHGNQSKPVLPNPDASPDLSLGQ